MKDLDISDSYILKLSFSFPYNNVQGNCLLAAVNTWTCAMIIISSQWPTYLFVLRLKGLE